MNRLTEKFKEVLLAVLPIVVIVFILHLTIAPLEINLLIKFLLGALCIVAGLAIFLLGTDIGIIPIGSKLGKGVAKSNKIWVVVIAGLALGFFISIAEPDLHILGNQIAEVTGGVISSTSILLNVSLGVALMVTIGLLRIVFNFPLYKLLTGIYLVIFILSLFTSNEFLSIAFDASGATTGALTVPFMLALALGISSLKKAGKTSKEDSFGLVGIASSGAIMAVMLMNIFGGEKNIQGALDVNANGTTSILQSFLTTIPTISKEIFLALFPILAIFMGYQWFFLKLSKKKLAKILKGVVYVFIGLVLFLVGVNAGFMEVGSVIGYTLASLDSTVYLLLISFVLGLVTILAEPAVYVLTHQIEDVTQGYVKRKIILLALSLGVGLAVLLSMIRILIPGLLLWHMLLPGYILAIGLMYVIPKMFVGMAFDAGGVASGPMTATFILAFVQGAAEAIEGADVLMDGFGMIAMVAMMPIITLQLVGLIFKFKSGKGGLQKNGTKK
ncbi:Protein of unknown function [Carnobacterium iners]|uniref:DUF1538 domain-containing protein n=1 Tax=Carnobacterium iners TaxID=1073423 RepID=A0A1X7N7Q9_9LACT|nr:Protein of unknown function [Carnobacterium iners]SMH33535.1 Protein of unknown function [Carnobacterium iners]